VHRSLLLQLLDGYQLEYPGELECVERIRELVGTNPSCFERTCMPGHITASAWIVSHDHTQYLLTHHRKLDRWLQLGGHADGETDALGVALREAREESGMADFDVLHAAGAGIPLDVDVHMIPARPGEPAHEHHDIRFLLVAGRGQRLEISDESNDLRWFSRSEVAEIRSEESLWRLREKAERVLRRDAGTSAAG
jgi:8-oxo-dGTP pyrophosphatase MutT (NUDIX family)